MPTIAKNTNRASEIISNAKNIRCFSNGSSGEPLPSEPTILGVMNPGDTSRPLVKVSQIGYLRHELTTPSTKLVDAGDGKFKIRVHSNLWFEFTN